MSQLFPIHIEFQKLTCDNINVLIVRDRLIEHRKYSELEIIRNIYLVTLKKISLNNTQYKRDKKVSLTD